MKWSSSADFDPAEWILFALLAIFHSISMPRRGAGSPEFRTGKFVANLVVFETCETTKLRNVAECLASDRAVGAIGVRELFSPEQVAMLFGGEVSAWLTGDITQDRAPEIRQYVMRELGVTEVTSVTLVPRLSQSFLEAQPDDWVLRLYEFLSGQEAALRRRLDTIPLIRLADGSHVVARENGNPPPF